MEWVNDSTILKSEVTPLYKGQQLYAISLARLVIDKADV